MNISDTSIPPLSQTWKRMLQAAGQEAGALKRSTALTLAAAVAQGLAFACFYPFFSALLDTPARPGSAVFWLTAMTSMDFGYGGTFNEESPEAYERLILDALLGDAPLFPHQREVDLSWRILDPVIDRWAAAGEPDGYRPGSWGPASAHQLLARDGRTWRRS